jgi:hypothetical protein
MKTTGDRLTMAKHWAVLAAGVILNLLGLGVPLWAQHVAGYQWPDDHSEHVLYIGRDDRHIHELWLQKGGSWQHNDLIQNNCNGRFTLPPPAFSNSVDVAGFVFTEDRSEHVAYIGTDLHLHELWLKSMAAGGDNCWHHTDLTTVAGTLADPAGAVAAYEWPDDHSEHFVYRGQDGYVHEISNSLVNGWRGNDFSTSPTAQGAVAAYVWPSDHSEHIVYIGTDSNVYELWKSRFSSNWGITNIGFAAGSALAAYAWPEDNSEHILSVDYYLNPGVIENYLTGSPPWNVVNLFVQVHSTSGEDYPPQPNSVALAGYVWPSNHTEHAIYVGFDNDVHELYLKRGEFLWHHNDLSSTVQNLAGQNPTAPNPSTGLAGYVWTEDNSEHVIYLSCDNSVNELYLGDDVIYYDPNTGFLGPLWFYNNLTQAANAPAAPGCSY